MSGYKYVKNCKCPVLDNVDAGFHKYISGNCGIHNPRPILERILFGFLGILTFPLLFIAVAGQSTAYDQCGDYEEGDKLVYDAFQAYKQFFWRNYK